LKPSSHGTDIKQTSVKARKDRTTPSGLRVKVWAMTHGALHAMEMRRGIDVDGTHHRGYPVDAKMNAISERLVFTAIAIHYCEITPQSQRPVSWLHGRDADAQSSAPIC
jgi:hypothetical protein